MNKIIFVATFFFAITSAYAGNVSKTSLLDSQNWTLDSEVSNSETCAQSVATSIEPPSTKDEYFIAYDHPYNAGSHGRLEVWVIGTVYFPNLNEVRIVTVGENLLTLEIFANNYPEKKLLKSKTLQATLDPANNRLVMYARQIEVSGKVIESCDYIVDSIN